MGGESLCCGQSPKTKRMLLARLNDSTGLLMALCGSIVWVCTYKCLAMAAGHPVERPKSSREMQGRRRQHAQCDCALPAALLRARTSISEPAAGDSSQEGKKWSQGWRCLFKNK